MPIKTKKSAALSAARIAATAHVPREGKTRIEFCAAWRISLSFYNKMRAKGLGPRETIILDKHIIKNKHEAEWALERENDSTEAAAVKTTTGKSKGEAKRASASVAA